MYALPLIALLVASCGESSLLVPELEQESPTEIQTIEDGSLVSSGDSIPIAVDRSPETDADRLEVVLESGTGEVLGTKTIGQDELESGEELSIAVPELPAGTYRLVLTLFNGQSEVRSERRTFFVSGDELRIDSVSTYPASFFPDSTGLARTSIDAPGTSDPYLRWSIQGNVVSEGYLSDGLDEVEVNAPAEEGVYELQLELFPAGPTEDVTLEFSSTISQTTELVVRRTVEPGPNDLSPQESYYALFHFMGNTRDVGARPELMSRPETRLAMIGAPRPDIRQDVFGYYLNGSAGFQVNDVLVPFRDDRPTPFSLNFRLVPDEVTERATLLRSVAENDSFRLVLSARSGGGMELELGYGTSSHTFESPRPLLNAGTPTNLSISVVPQGSGVTVVWYRDGGFVGAESREFSSPSGPSGGSESSGSSEQLDGEDRSAADTGGDRARGAASETGAAQGSARRIAEDGGEDASWSRRAGITVIGGEDGFVGLIDEFGVFFRDTAAQPSTDTALFRKAGEEKYGTDLLYAEGFEGLSIPQDLEISGDVSIDQSALVVGPGGQVSFPALFFQQEGIVLEIDREPVNRGLQLRFFQVNAEEPLFRIENGRRLYPGTVEEADAEGTVLAAEDENPLTLQLVHRQGVLEVTGAAGNREFALESREFEGIRVESLSSSVTVRIRSLLAYREGNGFQAAFGDDES